ncbi:NADH:ubiquinone reductase (Na(+)-transporting) subunit D [Tissierella pigra]|uniref:NADH:ubiquinone reductase (Na(+)-transporting) subunit D n=1 Tax=Tissierella pigra TaxID=2607614 RepID=A0A6N7Y0Z5_9FIRM|nr:NADH:ubiquinone reductase (Na(+)-transporting) subunit D [Tissierella pigra]MBU5426343.1 NADH:ubiquinone reductase (Na(+)-transporting) subunit D [Tissierella pigra]MSU02168.1 NADH:ubiquinone reductase (Na(+)-transporting) subunit D [Tissierella pigra]
MKGDSPKKIFKMGLWEDNPVLVQIIGICSALAVTNLMLNSLIMGVGLIFVTALSSFTVSILRNYTPKHIRMMVQVLIIAAYVIIVDIFLKAYMPEMSKALGPYVGLIITNCIIMGRAEAYAQKNPPIPSFLDGVASGLGYTLVLLVIAFIRELLGFGTIFGIQVLGEWWTPWTIMIMPPAAFFILAVVIWITKTIQEKEKDNKKGQVANL